MAYVSEKDADTGVDELFMACPSCDQRTPIAQRIIFDSTPDDVTHNTPIVTNIIHDPSLVRTSKIKCTNAKCPANVVDSKVAQHLVTFHYNEDKLLGYICYNCHNRINTFKG